VRNWRDALIPQDASLRATLRQIDASRMQIALVVDAAGRLLGTVTDGDVRRALLRDASLESPVTAAMNRKPLTATEDQDRESIIGMMRARALHQIPLLDARGMVVGLEIIDELLGRPQHDNWVVLMAGGLGTRLHPLTHDTPKPMLKVGDRPILEHIVEAFVAQGFRRFYVSLNYLGDRIRAHFADGARWGAEIRYVVEDQPLGTAGALALLPQRPTAPLIVMNGDILTKLDFTHLLEFHARRGALATMCIRSYEFQIPYGVVSTAGERLVGIEEKPRQSCFVSAGIYVLSPAALELLRPGQSVDMPALFEAAIAAGQPTAAYHLRDYWLDIGRLEDFERANGDLNRIAGNP